MTMGVTAWSLESGVWGQRSGVGGRRRYGWHVNPSGLPASGVAQLINSPILFGVFMSHCSRESWAVSREPWSRNRESSRSSTLAVNFVAILCLLWHRAAPKTRPKITVTRGYQITIPKAKALTWLHNESDNWTESKTRSSNRVSNVNGNRTRTRNRYNEPKCRILAKLVRQSVKRAQKWRKSDTLFYH